MEGFEAFKKCELPRVFPPEEAIADFVLWIDLRWFDAELIPLHGLSRLLGRVERLLDKAPVRHVGAHEKGKLLDDLVKIVHENEC
jgi:hypothetical protein